MVIKQRRGQKKTMGGQKRRGLKKRNEGLKKHRGVKKIGRGVKKIMGPVCFHSDFLFFFQTALIRSACEIVVQLYASTLFFMISLCKCQP